MSYWTAHNRMGRASDNTCSCGVPAKDWALKEGRERIREVVQGRLLGYSNDPEDYHALCRKCHSVQDNNTPPANHDLRFCEKNGREGGKKGGPKGAATMNARRRKCLACGKVSTPGPLANHQIKLGHVGREDL